MKLAYEMKNEKQELVCSGQSEHCFLDDKGLPLRLKKKFPEFYQVLMDYKEKK